MRFYELLTLKDMEAEYKFKKKNRIVERKWMKVMKINDKTAEGR